MIVPNVGVLMRVVIRSLERRDTGLQVCNLSFSLQNLERLLKLLNVKFTPKMQLFLYYRSKPWYYSVFLHPDSAIFQNFELHRKVLLLELGPDPTEKIHIISKIHFHQDYSVAQKVSRQLVVTDSKVRVSL